MRSVSPLEERVRMLWEWRKWVPRLTRAILEVYPGAEVYLIGSAVKNRLTGASDVDILIVVSNPPESPRKRALIRVKIEDLAGLPDHHPFEIHFVKSEDKEKYLAGAGAYIKLV